MRDLRSSKFMWLKAILFLGVGIAAAVLLLLETPTLSAGLLLLLAIWAFCRAYYFAFYVIEHYVDPNYRFSGLLSFGVYLMRKKSSNACQDR